MDTLREQYEAMRDRVTLDGRPAVIIAWMQPHPIVRRAEVESGGSVAAGGYHFSRAAIQRVLSNGGAFRS